jgi:hypothetical protein
MQPNPFLAVVALGAAALLLAPACSEDGGMAGPPGDDQLFVPAGLPNTTTDTQGGWLTLVAFTLVQEASAPALYVAVRNDGQAPACNVGMLTDLFDKAGYLVASAGDAVWSRQHYRLDPDVMFDCIDPGQIAMAASTNLPADLVIAELGSLRHSFPGFIVPDIVAVDGPSVSGVKVVTKDAGTSYTGTFTNGFEVPVSAPTVRVFPVNRVGRPLGMATSSTTTDVPPGGSLTFETSPVDDPGIDYEAYAAATPGN